MRTVAVLPIKRFTAAKQRLTPALATGDRRALATAMVADVLDALEAVPSLDAIVAVTSEPVAAGIARDAGATVVPDRHETGQSAAAAAGIDAARELGADRVLLVPGDCPALDPDEVEGLLARDGAAPAVAIVADRHGTGTNALLLTPPDAMAPAFGPGSFARHAARARAAGAAVEVCDLPSLSLDVDTPDDLAALRAALAARPAGAARTRALLDRLAPAPAC